MIRRCRLLFSSLVFTSLFAVVPGRAASLKANVGELLLGRLQPGQTYDLTQLMKVPYQVTYASDEEAELLIEPLVPEGAVESKPGFEPIPDASWVTVTPGQASLGTGKTVDVQITFSIPDDDALLGKKYIVYVWAHTKGSGRGVSTGMGLKTRFLLSIDSERQSGELADVPAEEQGTLNFSVMPQELRPVREMKPGKKYNVAKLAGEEILVRNKDGVERTYKLEAVLGSDLAVTLPEGYSWPPDPKALTFPSDTLTVPAHGEAALDAVLSLPKDPSLKGKRLLYVLRVSPAGRVVTTGIIAKIYVHVK